MNPMQRNHRRVLIVGTVPYNEMSTSRAFDSYFHFWEKENLAQIFSNAKTPAKGHCGTLYQITDARMLRRHFKKSTDTGRFFRYDELPDSWTDSALEVGTGTAKLYSFGSRKSSLVYMLRKWIWKKKYWCTETLISWLDEFSPECVFLSFSDDFFIPQIALFVAERYNIPIVSSIGDDYYFNYKFSLSPLYHLYKLSYRKLIRKVFSHKGSAIYIGDKIRDKYNEAFGLGGETVYLTSTITRRPFKVIPEASPKISYFGNIRLGRNESLKDIGQALGRIDRNYVLNVYSNENDQKFCKPFVGEPNIHFCGAVPYCEVAKKTVESDIVVVVEGFQKKDVDKTRYSLSTKIADSLSSGVAVFAYGSHDCGAIEYAESTNCIVTCVEKNKLEESLRSLIFDFARQQENYKKSVDVVVKNHRLEKSTKIFESVVDGVCGGKQ